MSSVGPVKVSVCEFGGTSQGVVLHGFRAR